MVLIPGCDGGDFGDCVVLEVDDSLQDDGGAPWQHLVGAFDDGVFKVPQGKVDLSDQGVGTLRPRHVVDAKQVVSAAKKKRGNDLRSTFKVEAPFKDVL